MKLTDKILKLIDKDKTNIDLYEDCLDTIKIMCKEDKERAYTYLNKFRKKILENKPSFTKWEDIATLEEIRKESYLIEARDNLDSYLIYLEWNREPDKKFYLPRRNVLLPLVKDLQDLAEGKIKFLGVSLPPRTGKSTLCIMFMTWIMGKRPDIANVMSGYSDKLTEGFYREIFTIMQDKQTYLWSDVFPEVSIVDNSAKNESIDLSTKKRFPTLTCRSISGTLTGAVEIGKGGILYCDDLVEDLEESLNPDRLQTKYDAYLNQLKDRKKDGSLELMIGTRWNVLDPLGRIANQYDGNPDYRFRVIPALNEYDESNFDYKLGVGFSTEYYRDMRDSIDDATWWAKYMGQPYIREGLLFPQAELNYYNGTLPSGEPDRIVAVGDIAWGGGDSLSMPVAYIYGDSVYVHDVVFNRGDKTQTQPLVVGVIKRNMPHQVQFEANNGGSEYSDEISRLLLIENVHINLSYRKAPNTLSKMARIIQVAPEIKKLYFRDMQHCNFEYKMFMQELTTFVVTGKNKHDDAADSLAMLVNLIFNTYSQVTIMKKPF